MSEADYLRGACDRADARVTSRRRELHRFTCHGTDLAEATEHQARRLRKYLVRYWGMARACQYVR